MMLDKSFFIFCFLIGLSHSYKSYEGYKVIKMEEIRSLSMLNELVKFVEEIEFNHMDFWSKPNHINSAAEVLVSPRAEKKLIKFCRKRNLAFHTTIQNVQRIFDEENSVNTRSIKETFSFKKYHGYEEIDAYLKQLSEKYSDFVTLQSIGKSFEGRDMKVVKIEKAGTDAPILFVEAGIHAREWIAPTLGTYLLHALLEVEKNKEYLDKVNIHIVPLANPDGYEYSRQKDRMWRKTRSTNSSCLCRGVDPNRNWDFHWSESGVSTNPCSNIFPGKTPFSEPETVNIKNYVEGLKKQPYMAFCLHSAAELLLFPFGYAYGAFPKNVEAIKKTGEQFLAKLNSVHGQKFSLLNAADLYPAAGASDDYYAGALGIPFVYTIELRRGGSLGFDLPASQIIPSGEELFEGFKVFIDKGKEFK